MSIFVPPLSADPYYKFLFDDITTSGYASFLAYANGGKNELTNSLKISIETYKTKYQALLQPTIPNPTSKLRDPGNYIGFRMSMRISQKLDVSPLSLFGRLSVSLTEGGWSELIWDNDAPQPTSIRPDPGGLANEAVRQATEGDLFIIRYFFDKFNKNPGSMNDSKPEIIWRFLSIWSAIQLPLAQVIFNAKSKNKDLKRPYEQNPAVYPIKYGIAPPPHSTYPSGHAAGAGALAGLIYFICLASKKDYKLAESYIPIAYRVGLMREFSNLHWTEDTDAGFLTGFRFTYAVLAVFSKNKQLADLEWLVAKVCADL